MNWRFFIKPLIQLDSKTVFYLRGGIIFFGLIALVSLQHNTPAPSKNYTPRAQQEYMHNLAITHFTAGGLIKDQIYANYWAYLPATGNSALVQPKMHLVKPSGAIWLIQAKYGKAWHKSLESKISRLDLHDDVIIERLATAQFMPITMKTAEVSYFPETEYIETAKFVELDKPGLHLTGVGMQGDLTKDTLQLLSNVTTNYAINS